MMELPEDLLMEILSRLRVKDLIRLKSVCKSWLHMISSNHFIQLHLKKSSFKAFALPKEVPFPHKKYMKMENLGSCNGLVCLSYRVCLYGYGEHSEDHSTIYLWNPATRITSTLPTLPYSQPGQHFSHRVVCGWLGCGESDSQDYKLLVGTMSHMHLIRPHVDGDYWKSTHIEVNTWGCYSAIGTLINGSVHWPKCKFYPAVKYVIMSYDLRKEDGAIGEIPTPNQMCDVLPFYIGEVRGCLSILSGTTLQISEVWVMKEFGVKDSWTKFMVLPNMDWYFVPSPVEKDEQGVTLEHPGEIMSRSPLFRKTMYVESLISPWR